jgi:hypothetical protein
MQKTEDLYYQLPARPFHTWLNEEKKAVSALPLIRCPSRRSTVAIMDAEKVDNPGTNAAPDWPAPSDIPNGPRGDYAIAMIVAPYTDGGRMEYHYRTGRPHPGDWIVYVAPNYDVDHHRGAIRMAAVDKPTEWGQFNGDNYKAWAPYDTFAWLSDGTSNQILFGEKHIPASRVGICQGRNGTSGEGAVWDCGILMPADRWREAICARGPTTHWDRNGGAGDPEAIVGDPNKYANSNPDHYAFGSAHPGISNFLIGDGAVRSLTASTLPLLLCRLVDTKDGNAVALP